MQITQMQNLRVSSHILEDIFFCDTIHITYQTQISVNEVLFAPTVSCRELMMLEIQY